MEKTVCLKPKKKLHYQERLTKMKPQYCHRKLISFRYLIGSEFLYVTVYTILDADIMRLYVLHRVQDQKKQLSSAGIKVIA